MAILTEHILRPRPVRIYALAQVRLPKSIKEGTSPRTTRSLQVRERIPHMRTNFDPTSCDPSVNMPAFSQPISNRGVLTTKSSVKNRARISESFCLAVKRPFAPNVLTCQAFARQGEAQPPARNAARPYLDAGRQAESMSRYNMLS